jgi:hypothetical protein
MKRDYKGNNEKEVKREKRKIKSAIKRKSDESQ